MKNTDMIKTIGIAAPASSFKKDDFNKAELFIRKLGLKAIYTNTIFKKDGFNAGPVKERAKDLLHIFSNSEIDAVFFARGGYGCSQLLPEIDKEDLSKDIRKKVIMGYSDLTSLFCYLYTKYGKECLYGPNITSQYFQNKALVNRIIQRKTGTNKKIKILRSGAAKIKAPIFGGCLSVLASMAGTPYLRSLKGHILFIEDTNEAPYKLDRMLTQLIQAKIITGIKAIAVGAMENCDSPSITWKDVVTRIASELNVPAIYGINAGHAGFDTILRLGATAEIDLNKKEFKIKD